MPEIKRQSSLVLAQLKNWEPGLFPLKLNVLQQQTENYNQQPVLALVAI